MRNNLYLMVDIESVLLGALIISPIVIAILNDIKRFIKKIEEKKEGDDEITPQEVIDLFIEATLIIGTAVTLLLKRSSKFDNINGE